MYFTKLARKRELEQNLADLQIELDEYNDLPARQLLAILLHEVLAGIGLGGRDPRPDVGVMSIRPWSEPRLSLEERAMILGREGLAPLTFCATTVGTPCVPQGG